MSIHITNHVFICPKCGSSYTEDLEEACGVSCCPVCGHEFDWAVEISY